MAKKLDLLGKKFGRITVTNYLGIVDQKTLWEYTCECGIVKKEYGAYINAGRIQSCGCLVKERIGALNRMEAGQSAKNRLLAIYKKSARDRKYSWELNDDEFLLLTSSPCHYCGIVPSNDTRKISPHSYGHYVFNGVDRIDNSQGYKLSNCVPCCRNCNLAKCDFSYNDFLNWINRLISFRSRG